MAEADVKYYIDGTDFATYGVYVQASNGVVCKPAMKDLLSDDWLFAHGTVYDLSSVYYKEATLQLRCFIDAIGFSDYITKANNFLGKFADSQEHTLTVWAGTTTSHTSIAFSVLCKDSVDIEKAWMPGEFVGKFTLKLKVPHPTRPSGSWSTANPSSADSVSYFLDEHNFLGYGVYVQASNGITTIPQIKEPLTYDWGTADGLDYHQDGVRYQERTIQLKCIMEANTFPELLNKALTFFSLLIANRTLRLRIMAGDKALVYEVICKDEVSLVPDFSHQNKCVGTFTLRLIEPEPVKRVLYGNGTCSITIKSKSPVNIYWGDGTHAFGVSGNDVSQTVSHSVSSNYVIITGEPNDFTSFTSNFTTVWSRLL